MSTALRIAGEPERLIRYARSRRATVLSPAILERLWARIDVAPSGCWTWRGTYINGVPYLNVKTDQCNVRRLAWLIAAGLEETGRSPVPTCGDESCVRPEHTDLLLPMGRASLYGADAWGNPASAPLTLAALVAFLAQPGVAVICYPMSTVVHTPAGNVQDDDWTGAIAKAMALPRP